MGLLITHLLKVAGVTGWSLWKATKELAEEAEMVSMCLRRTSAGEKQ